MISCKKCNKMPTHCNLIELQMLERQFILDCIAVRQICDDYAKTNPKHGSIIPPYNGQLDPYAKSYFESVNIQKILEKTGQTPPGTSIEGPIADRFIINGAPTEYIRQRNKNGCGRSPETWRGH
uniref:SJCHGC05617 protein n=1 Tax=Schistosoma japonicum TaxID=6182 RepID=Q5DFX2_SCHJA|nr:SJCHGC05617 protein [Schistosoma japonicum]